MRTGGALVVALAGAALLPAPAATAATPMSAVIVHLGPTAAPARNLPAREVAGWMERAGRRTQGPALALLAELQREGHVRHVRPLWIAGAVAVTADASAINALRARPDVRSIEADSVLPIRPGASAAAEPGNAATGAPELWSNGIDGTGVTVATLDTGVDLTHAELASRYRGGGNSWFDPFGQHSEPADLNGHGTQVTGVIVAGSGMGMAPGARFIAARVFNDSGVSTDSAVHLAFQWLLDPDGNPATHDAPNVVNASWGAQLAACDREFEPDLQALRAAQILPVFAAGNDGPGASSDTSPANLPEAFAVGASASETTIAPFSSVGPSRCGSGQFPALVAAGTGVRTTDRFGLTASGLAGTSFAAPHVAGALALLLQAAPQLTSADQANLLMQSARDLGAPGPDSTFGAGSLDVAAAARLLSPTLDFSAPVLSGATSSGAQFEVHAVDAGSTIAAGEVWADVDPGVGAGQPMAAADGSFDSASEDLVAVVPGLAPGDHTIGFRARDAAGNWSSASLLVIDVPSPPAPPAPLSSNTLAGPPSPVATLAVATPSAATPLAPAALGGEASDGFEDGLRWWPRRVGFAVALRGAAITGRRGLRVSVVAGTRAFVQRPLLKPADHVQLSFDLRPRALATAGAWIELAAIGGAGGIRPASLELRTAAQGSLQLRLSSAGVGRSNRHSRPVRISRGRSALVLRLDAGRAAMLVDGRERGALARGTDRESGTTLALGVWRPAPARSTGYLDIDNVTVRTAPDAT